MDIAPKVKHMPLIEEAFALKSVKSAIETLDNNSADTKKKFLLQQAIERISSCMY